MPKMRNSGPEPGSMTEHLSAGIDELASAVNEVQSMQVDAVDTGKAEADALRKQRQAYDRIKGRGGKSRQAAPNARETEEELEDPDEPEALEDEELEDEDDELPSSEWEDDHDEDDLDDDEPGGRARRRDRVDETTLQRLRRMNAPEWVFDLPVSRQKELAESAGGWQSGQDREITTLRESLHQLEARIGTEASEESRAKSSDDLEEGAAQLARALGFDEDDDAVKAIRQFGRLARGGTEDTGRKVQVLESMLETMLIDNAAAKLGAGYPQLLKDERARAKWEKKVRAQAKTGAYRDNVEALYSDAALLAFGPPETPRRKQRVGEKTSRPRPVTQGKRTAKKRPKAGTMDAQRAVFDRIRKRNKSRLSQGR